MATNTKKDDKAKILGEEAESIQTFLTLEDVLGKDVNELTALAKSVYSTEKLGDIPFTAIDFSEYKQAKKDCMKISVEDGVVNTTVDDDKLMVKIILIAVDKDDRSNFTFASKALLEKLGVPTADAVLGKLLSPGEITNFAVAIQDISGFSKKKAKKDAEDIKNS